MDSFSSFNSSGSFDRSRGSGSNYGYYIPDGQTLDRHSRTPLQYWSRDVCHSTSSIYNSPHYQNHSSAAAAAAQQQGSFRLPEGECQGQWSIDLTEAEQSAYSSYTHQLGNCGHNNVGAGSASSVPVYQISVGTQEAASAECTAFDTHTPVSEEGWDWGDYDRSFDTIEFGVSDQEYELMVLQILMRSSDLQAAKYCISSMLNPTRLWDILDAAVSKPVAGTERTKQASMDRRNGRRTSTFTCVICKQSTTRRSNMEYHYRSHLDIKPVQFKCHYCSKMFRSKSHQTRHANTCQSSRQKKRSSSSSGT